MLYKHSVHTVHYLKQLATKAYKSYFYKKTNAEQSLWRQAFMYVCTYVSLDRWMVARIDIRNVVCIMIDCV